MLRRLLLAALVAWVAAGLEPRDAGAQESVKVGLIVPMTGPFALTGNQVEASVRF